MKQLNEIKRMQQLAGIINEIKIDKPFIKKINVNNNTGEGYNFHTSQNKFIENVTKKYIHAYVDIYKNVFVIWGLYEEEKDLLELALQKMGIKFITKNYRGDIGISINKEYLNIII